MPTVRKKNSPELWKFNPFSDFCLVFQSMFWKTAFLEDSRCSGKRSRGRQRLTYLESLSKWMTEQVDETEKMQVARLKILRTAKDRELWRTMVVNVRGEYGT